MSDLARATDDCDLRDGLLAAVSRRGGAIGRALLIDPLLLYRTSRRRKPRRGVVQRYCRR